MDTTITDTDGVWSVDADFTLIDEGLVNLIAISSEAISPAVIGVLDISPPQFPVTPEALDITNNTAIIHWITNEESNSKVQYGTSIGTWGYYPLSKYESSMTTDHNIMLTNLNGSTKYFYRVGSTDEAGNLLISI